MYPRILILPRRLLVAVPILRDLGVHALLLHPGHRGRRLGRHGRARRRAGVRRPGARPQEPLLRRREDAPAVGGVQVLARVRLDLETLGGRERRGGREGLQVGEGPEGAAAEGEAGVQELGLEVVQDVGWEAAVGFHVAEAESRGRKRTMEVLC